MNSVICKSILLLKIKKSFNFLIDLTPRLLALRLLFIVLAPSLTRGIFACSASFTPHKDSLAWTNTLSRKPISQRLCSQVRATTHFARKCSWYQVGFVW
jgi:hypothetical protein